MGRLIDADALKHTLTIISAKANVSVGNLLALLNFIDKQPTAFDAEKVLEELQDMASKPMELVYDVILINSIIEIVKKGGVKND